MVKDVPTVCGQSVLRSYARPVAILGLLLVLGSGLAYVYDRGWAFEARLGAGLGVILLLTAMLLRPDAVRTTLTGRPARYGSNAVILSLAFLGILALLNFLSYKHNHDYDLTETRDFTLSEQTLQILETLAQPVQVICFFQAGDPRLTLAQKYLKRYTKYTGYLSYEIHDPTGEPALAQRFGLADDGLVFVSGDRYYTATVIDEQTLTSGLIRVTGKSDKMVYFITGHGERNTDDTSPEGYSSVREALERENYIVSKLALTSTLPADDAVLILAGADHNLFKTETQLIKTWLTGGGKLLLMADPLQPTPLVEVLKAYGLSFDSDFAVDAAHSAVTLAPQGLTQQLTTPMVSHYPFHEITRGLNGYQAFFPFARSIDITPPAAPDEHVAPLLTTSPDSWAETNPSAGHPEYNKNVDRPGPLHLGAAAEDRESGMRLVVIGNSSFVANQNISPQAANLDLFMNAVNWLAEDDELISIRPKQPGDRRIFLTPMQVNFTFLTSLIVLPLSLLVVGAIVWWNRR